MRHCREDYNGAIKDIRSSAAGKFMTTITFPVVLGTPIPDDEPVFLLRAQDPFAAEAVAMYAAKLMAHSRGDADLAFARLAQRHSDLMAAWPRKKDYPDAPGVNEPTYEVTPQEHAAAAGPVEDEPEGSGGTETVHEPDAAPQEAPAPVEDNGPH